MSFERTPTSSLTTFDIYSQVLSSDDEVCHWSIYVAWSRIICNRLLLHSSMACQHAAKLNKQTKCCVSGKNGMATTKAHSLTHITLLHSGVLLRSLNCEHIYECVCPTCVGVCVSVGSSMFYLSPCILCCTTFVLSPSNTNAVACQPPVS